MRWRFFIFITGIFILLFPSVVFAESMVVVSVIDNQITTAETASFRLEITNTASKPQKYTIYSLQSGQGWTIDPYPAKDKIVSLNQRQSYTTTIQVRPLEEFSPGIYHVSITIESDLGERHNRALKVYLAPEEQADYLPAVKVEVDMDERINPKKPLSIKLFLENRNPLNLSGLQIQVQSEMPEFVKEVAVDLPPLESRTVEFSILPYEFQQPKEYTLFFVFKRDGETIKVVEREIEIISLNPDFTVSALEETVFLKTFSEVTITNEGNVLNTQEAKVPVSFWRGLFTSGEGEVKTIAGQRYLVWEITLSPNESRIVHIVTNYRILIYVLVTIILFLAFYFRVQSSVKLTKKAVTTKHGHEDALSEIKIKLEVRNKSRKKLKDVLIFDYVPGIVNVQKSLELGTLKPRAIKHLKKRTKVIWSLAELDAHEHRIITYGVKARLHILGTLSLPRAVVEYKEGRRKCKAYSNIFRLRD